MTHTSLPRLFPRSSVSHGERRLAYQQAPSSNLNHINNLFMRESVEGDEVTKNQYAYDTVQDRVREYQTRATALLTTLGQIGKKRGRDTIGTIRAPLDAAADSRTIGQVTTDLMREPREQQLRFRVDQFPNFLFARTTDGRFLSLQTNRSGAQWQPYAVNAELFYRNAIVVQNNGIAVSPEQNYLEYSPTYARWARRGGEAFSKTANTYRYDAINRYSATGGVPYGSERVSRVYWNVVQLERHYLACERLIRQLEIDAGVRAPNGSPRDGQETLDQRMLQARKATLAAQMQARDDAAKLQTISLDMYSRPFDTIGEAQVYKLLRVDADTTAEFSRARGEINEEVGTPILVSGGVKYYRIPQSVARNLNTSSTRLRLTRGGSTFTEGGINSVATVSRSSDGLNNLIFTFEAAREVTRNIEVNQPDAVYTGRSMNFDVSVTGTGSDESETEALANTTITIGDTNVVLGDALAVPTRVNGVRFRRVLAGNAYRITADSINDEAVTVPIRFTRTGQAPIERQARILAIGATPNVTMPEGESRTISVNPLTEGGSTIVSLSSVNRLNATTPYDPAAIPGPIGAAPVTTPSNNIRLSYENGILTARGDKAETVNVYFYHGNQRIMRTIEVTRAPETIEVNQPEPMYTGHRRRVEIGPRGMSAERRRATVVEYNDQPIAVGETFTRDGVTIVRDADGNVTVASTNDLECMIPLKFRGGAGTTGNTIDVNVEVKNITVTPGNSLRARESVLRPMFTVNPLEVMANQGHPTFVSLTRLAGRPPYTEAPAGAVGAAEVIQNGFGLTFVNGVLNVRDTTPNANYRTIKVYFYNGHQMIEREIEGGEIPRIILQGAIQGKS